MVRSDSICRGEELRRQVGGEFGRRGDFRVDLIVLRGDEEAAQRVDQHLVDLRIVAHAIVETLVDLLHIPVVEK